MTDRHSVDVRVVLCRPNHPGNIGSAARAMSTMGLRDLRLVAPARYPAPEAKWMASNALEVLDAARVHATLHEAIDDCVFTAAFSARPREWSLEVLPLRDAASRVVARAAHGPVAMVFGNEAAGLTNDELLACQLLVHIPTDDRHTSLNLAQAVQVAAYEVHLQGQPGVPLPRAEKLATVRDIEGLHEHLERAAIASGFHNPAAPGRLLERLRRMIARAALEREEVNILRGLLRALMKPQESDRNS